MEVSAVTALFNTIGMGGVFLYAAWYLMQRLEAQAAEQRAEALKRESRLVVALHDSDVYTRTTMAGVIERNTEAMTAMGSNFESLACRDLRKDDVRTAIEKVNRRAGEMG